MRVAAAILCVVIALAGTAVRAQSKPALPKDTGQHAKEQARKRAPKPAQRGDAGAPFALGLCFDAPWYMDPGYDAFADNDAAARLGLWLAYDVVALRTDTFVAVELGWGSEREDGKVFGVADTELSTQVAYLGATMRWVPIAWLQPHLRLATGAAFVDAELTQAGKHFQDRATGLFNAMTSPYASIGLGVTLRTATRSFENKQAKFASLSFGVMFEGGYTLAKSIDVTLERTHSGANDIALSEVKLGQLERSGPYLRVSLVGRI